MPNEPEQNASPTAEPQSPTPVTVETDDGWTVDSHSKGSPVSKDDIASLYKGEESQRDDGDDDTRAEATSEQDDDAEQKSKDQKPEPQRRRKTREERKNEIQAEINALTRRKHDLARQIASEESRLRDAPRDDRGRFSREAGDPAPQSAPARRDEKPVPAREPAPTWEAFDAEGKSWDEYQAAYREWDLKDRETALEERIRRTREEAKAEFEREHRARQEAQEAARAREAYQASLAKARKAHEDFESVVNAERLSDFPMTPFMKDLVELHHDSGEVLYRLASDTDLMADLANLQPTVPMMHAALSMEDPIPLLTHLVENPDEFSRLARLPRAAATLALGKLTASLEGAASPQPGPPPSRPAISSAGAPVRPVAGRRSTTGHREPKHIADLDLEEYIRVANDREERTGRVGA